MKTITTAASVRKADSSLDATLNPVVLDSGEIVSWGVAFPRPGRVTRRSELAEGTGDESRPIAFR
jgi:hypothetical protein